LPKGSPIPLKVSHIKGVVVMLHTCKHLCTLVIAVGLMVAVAATAAAYEVEYNRPRTGTQEAGRTSEQPAADQPAATQIPARRVAVLKLKVDGPHANQIRQWLPELIESRLAEHGWMVLARGETMQQIQAEQSLPGVDATTAPGKDKLIGASALLDLTARITIKEVDAAINIGLFSLGGMVKVKVELSGQAVDTTTGVIYPVGVFTSQVSKLRRLAVVLPSSHWIGGGFNYGAVKETMVGQAADRVAGSLVKKLDEMPWVVPGRERQISDAPSAVYLTFPPDRLPRIGDEYGIFRGDRMIAKVRITALEGTRARCEILAQLEEVCSTDVARPLAIEIPVEVSTQ